VKSVTNLLRGLKKAGFGAGESGIMPQARLSGPMPWVIAIMVALTVIALAAGLTLNNLIDQASAELEGGVTVQILEPRAEIRRTETLAAEEALRALPGVRSTQAVPQEEVDALIEPWLGIDEGAGPGFEIPVPALIDVRLKGEAGEAAIASIRGGLAEASPSARVDAQADWLKPVFGAIASLQWLAIALVALLALALAAAVLLAARTALGTNRDTIEIVHLLGGTDRQIARIFQRSIGIDAVGGGIVGFTMALVVILFLSRRFAGLGAGMVDAGALAWGDWLLLALVPVISVLLAMLTARLTVLHALHKML
jgi:cell division transport system permease protein